MPSVSASTAPQGRGNVEPRRRQSEVEIAPHPEDLGHPISRPQAPVKRKRASAACLQCRRVKSRCKRGDNPQLPCERCQELGCQCEIVKSRRGRVLGSRNKSDGLEKTLAHVQAALDRIRDEADLQDEPRRKRKRVRIASSESGESDDLGSGGDEAVPADRPSRPQRRASRSPILYSEFELDDDGGEIAELPLESMRHSPDPDRRPDHDHPLSLLSAVGHDVKGSSQESEEGGIAVSDDRAAILLPGWSRVHLQRAAARRRHYFRHRPGAAQRDVVSVLDPISRQFLTVEQGEHLVEQFFTHLQPQIGFMDPSIHTLVNMRMRSALLVTAVLATGAQSQDIAGAKQLAQVLYKHAEGLLLLIISRNVKSPEIVLALLILSLWPRCPERIVDDRSRILLALAINMALEMGLNRERPCGDEDENAQKWHRDRMRTWISCVIQDRSLSAVSGKPTMIQVELDLQAMNHWLDQPLSTPGDRMLVGFLELRSIEHDVRQRLNGIPRYMIENVRVSAGELLEAWARTWITPELHIQAPSTANMMHILAHHVHLLMTTASQARQGNIVAIAKAALEFVLAEYGQDARYICRTVCGMISWAGVLLLRLAKDDNVNLVRDVGLVLAPYGDRFEMSYAHFYGSFLLGLCLDSDNLNPPSIPRFSKPPPLADMTLPSGHAIANHDLFSVGGDLWPGPGGLAAQSTLPELFPAGDVNAGDFLNPLLSADQLGPLLGLDAGANLDFELPWDMQQGTSNPDASVVSPPLEWLFNDSVTARGGNGGDNGDQNAQPLWGFGLGWSNPER